MAGISLRHISKSYGDTHILKDVSLDVADGEFVTLVGPSGCGKSTLLRILAGLETADGGQVVIAGEDVSTIRPADRNLAMVFQSYALYPHLSVLDNMLTPLKLRDLVWHERLPLIGPLLARSKLKALRAQVAQAADILQIGHLLGRKPGQLSGGQRQRVALGRAMVRQPVAFLMDEPLSNLDAALRVHMRAELSQLHKRLGTTFVYVTHDQAEALTMSDRMAVMKGGRILQFGAPADIYTAPVSLTVAEFVGSPKINILPAEADGTGRVQLFETPINAHIRGGRQSVSLGIRPEHLELCAPEEAMIDGQVAYLENLGADIFVHITPICSDSRVIARCTPSQATRLRLGDRIYCRAQPEHFLVFHAQGHRLTTTLSVVEVA